jgi:hypothetical protein
VLPPFPVDDSALGVLWTALHPLPGLDHTSLNAVLDLYSQLGGSDPDAGVVEDRDVTVLRDPQYSVNDVIEALIVEVRRLRGG